MSENYEWENVLFIPLNENTQALNSKGLTHVKPGTNEAGQEGFWIRKGKRVALDPAIKAQRASQRKAKIMRHRAAKHAAMQEARDVMRRYRQLARALRIDEAKDALKQYEVRQAEVDRLRQMSHKEIYATY